MTEGSSGASLKTTEEAQRLLLAGAQQALQAGDLARFDDLMARLVVTDGPSEHERGMDLFRVWIGVVLILALFGITTAAVFRSSATASPYVSLLSGLAGIALGWLYGSGGAPVKTAGTGRRRGGN